MSKTGTKKHIPNVLKNEIGPFEGQGLLCKRLKSRNTIVKNPGREHKSPNNTY